jgi:ferrous iron transport protein B
VIIAVAGNPNCGKTTLFNQLTGLRYKVANYPGVTVERKFGTLALPSGRLATLVDLPGIYSLSGLSIDEQIATDTLLGVGGIARPDCLLVVLDASHLERNLYLASQLLDLGIPTIIALNMTDIAEKRGVKIMTELLKKELDAPVVKLIASEGIGIEELTRAIDALCTTRNVSSKRSSWIESELAFKKEASSIAEAVYGENVTNQPESARILLGAFLLSGNTQIRDPKSQQLIANSRNSLAGVDCSTFEATKRYEWINRIIKKCVVISDDSTGKSILSKIDRLLTHRVWGYVIFIAIFGMLFQGIFTFAKAPMQMMERVIGLLATQIEACLPEGPFKSLIVDGILAGVGNVLIFVPQIAILFFLLALLEDSGYLARAAFLMDRIMRPLGLQGRSFIPLLSSFACAIPGIMSTRTIPSWADRMATIMIAPLMSCSARLPVYTVLIAAFIPDTKVIGFFSLRGLTMLSMYMLGIVAAGVTGRILKLTAFRGKPALFVMEIPAVRLPLLKNALREAYDRAVTFINSAGTTILFCSVVLWFLASYPTPPTDYEGSRVEYSVAGRVGKAIEPVIEPLGFNWEIGIGILASFAAREVFVSTLATVYHLEDTDPDSQSLVPLLKAKNLDGTFSTVSALSLMIFFVFACQCMSTLAVTHRETGGWFWPGVMFSYMTLLAYAASFFFYSIFA